MKKIFLFAGVVFVVFSSFGKYSAYSQGIELSGETPILRNILIEEFTGNWCGYCPRGHIALRNILKDHSNVIPVMIHGGDTAEPMGTIGGDQLISSLDVWFPSATIDRFKYPGNENIVNVDTIWDDLILSRQDDNTYTQVDIEKSYDPNSRELEITLIIKFTKAQKGNFRLNAYLTENNLIFDQENCLNADPAYPDLFGRGDPIVGYVHDFVLRDMLGGTYGIIPDGASAIPLNVLAGQTYSYTFSTRLLEKYKPSDIHLVGYIMDYKGPLDSEILNAATCPLLETSVPYSKDQSLLKVYPNPNSGKFNIIFDTFQQGKVDVLVRNLQSQLVYRQIWYKDAGKGFLTITLDNLPTGIYFLELNSEEGVRYEKVVVGAR